jgi:hypothetical protein
MHPMFVTLFIETDADDLAVDEQHQQRHARQAKRGKPARVMGSPPATGTARVGPDG